MNETLRGVAWRKSTHSNGTGECVEVGLAWHKSTHSTAQGECVEVGTAWRKPTHSNGIGACVEVAPAPRAILIRDTTNRSGPTLTIPAPAWQALLAGLRAS